VSTVQMLVLYLYNVFSAVASQTNHCTHLDVMCAVDWVHICPYLAPVGCEVSVSVDGAHGSHAVSLVVFLAGLFG